MRTKRTAGAVLALLLLTLGLAACGSDGGSTAKASSPGTSATDESKEYGGGGAAAAEGEGDEVYAKDFAFSPKTLTVDKGTTVKFENQDGTAHTFTADDGSFDLGTVDPGKSATHTFDQTGTFTFHCEIHPTMKGTIEVK